MTHATSRADPPPLLLGASLLFWGWRTELLPMAALTAFVLEGARHVSWRWQFSDKDFHRLVDLTSVLLLVMTAYLYATRSVYGVFVLVQWLPILLFLIVGAQVYSTRATLPLSALFLTLRGRNAQRDAGPEQRIDVRFPYLAICVLSASVPTTRSPWFYVGVAGLAAWALWGVRPRRYPFALWGALLLLVVGLGYAGHLGLNRLQHVVGDLVVDWMEYRFWDRDPYQTTTAIGHIGRLKLSDRIVLRVRLPEQANGSMLLRQASYNSYASGIWRASGDRFEAVEEPPARGTWRLAAPRGAGKTVTVSGYLSRGRGLLALPTGTYRIENLPAEFVKRNPFGAVKAENGPALVTYTAHFLDAAASTDAEPAERDLHIPERYAPVLEKLAADLGLSGQRPETALATLGKHFQENFRYSLVQGRDAKYAPLADFLLRTRAGHCEYFATATALLLRAAGIPTRYATGFSVQEYSELEGAYVVRRRHAHSWALAYLDGTWRDVDFTPAEWVSLENQTAPWWEAMYDLASRIAFLFSRWQWSERDQGTLKLLVWLLVPLALLLAWRLYFKERIKQVRSKKRRERASGTGPGSDSAFYRIVNQLERSGMPRRPGETLNRWVRRVAEENGDAVDEESLRVALVLHYRYRFDPRGLSPEQKAALQATVGDWLTRHLT